MKSMLRRANGLGARLAIILGDEENRRRGRPGEGSRGPRAGACAAERGPFARRQASRERAVARRGGPTTGRGAMSLRGVVSFFLPTFACALVLLAPSSAHAQMGGMGWGAPAERADAVEPDAEPHRRPARRRPQQRRRRHEPVGDPALRRAAHGSSGESARISPRSQGADRHRRGPVSPAPRGRHASLVLPVLRGEERRLPLPDPAAALARADARPADSPLGLRGSAPAPTSTTSGSPQKLPASPPALYPAIRSPGSATPAGCSGISPRNTPDSSSGSNAIAPRHAFCAPVRPPAPFRAHANGPQSRAASYLFSNWKRTAKVHSCQTRSVMFRFSTQPRFASHQGIRRQSHRENMEPGNTEAGN